MAARRRAGCFMPGVECRLIRPRGSFCFHALVAAPVLHISDLLVHRGSTRILDRLGWTVSAGEHWVILGANGSGKTSLLSALTGYFTPTGGTVELLGERYGESDWRHLRERVGIVSSAI